MISYFLPGPERILATGVETVMRSAWATPINPFDGGNKKSALADALKSPWVVAPYLLLEIATIALLVLR